MSNNFLNPIFVKGNSGYVLGFVNFYFYILDEDTGKLVYNSGEKAIYLNGYDKYGEPELSEINPTTKKTSNYILKEK
jgi:hypothetical protein